MKLRTPDSDGSGEEITFGATKTTSQGSAFGAVGSGKGTIGPVDIRGGTGTVDVGCTEMSVAVYARSEDGQVAFALGVSQDRLYELHFYCESGTLLGVDYAGTDGMPITYEKTSGICGEDSRITRPAVPFPSARFHVPRPVGGFTISGDSIELPSGDRGWITIDGVTHTMVAFAGTGCRRDCGDVPFWFEIETLIWDPGTNGVTFGILRLDDPGNPVLTARVELPGFTTNYDDVTFDATFTTP